jgi:hypothetical protein
VKNPRTRLYVDPVEENSDMGRSGVSWLPEASLIGIESKRDGCGILN